MLIRETRSHDFDAIMAVEKSAFGYAKEGEYWMVQPLTPKGLKSGKGIIFCADALQRPEHWRE